MNTTQKQKVESDSHQARIALAAYNLWEKGGYQSGRHVEYWLLAEKQLQTGSRENPRFSVAPTLQPGKPARARNIKADT
jgi:hypothetical protein